MCEGWSGQAGWGQKGARAHHPFEDLVDALLLCARRRGLQQAENIWLVGLGARATVIRPVVWYTAVSIKVWYTAESVNRL